MNIWWIRRRWQQWKGQVLRWKQERAARRSLLKLASILAEGSQAAARLSGAATVKSADALKADAQKYKHRMSGIWLWWSSAQAAASGLSKAASSQIDALVQRLKDLDTDLVDALHADPGEARQKLKDFVRSAHQLTQEVQDMDICMRSQLRGDREGTASGPDSSSYKDFLERLAFEHDLLNRRITWLLTSQTILFAAYGFTVTKAPDTGARAAENDLLTRNFQEVIAWSGMIAAILMFIGILAAVRAKRAVWHDYQKDHNPRQKWGVRTGATWAGLVPDVFTPLLFAAAWLVVIVRSP